MGEEGGANMTEAVRPTVDQRVAASLKGFGVGGIVTLLIVFAAVLVAMPIAAVVVLIWAWLSYTPLREIGLKKPNSWLGVIVIGVVTGVGLKLFMKSVLLPYLGAPAVNM